MSGRLNARRITAFIGIAVALVFFLVNHLIYSSAYLYKIYAGVRDILVLGVAGITLCCGFVSYRRETDDRCRVFYFLIINLLIIVSTLHILRLLHGGLLCLRSNYY